MSKQRRLFEAELYRVARTQVLKSNDPEIWIHRDGLEMSLGIVMDEIHDYIQASLLLDDNPLRYLRQSFPDFVWKFHEGDDGFEAARIIATTDYVWMRFFGSLREGFISATQTDKKKPRVLCYKPEEVEEWVNAKMKTFVPKIRFVVNGNEKIANTIIE